MAYVLLLRCHQCEACQPGRAMVIAAQLQPLERLPGTAQASVESEKLTEKMLLWDSNNAWTEGSCNIALT